MSFDFNKFVSNKTLLKEYGNLGNPDLSDPRKTEPNLTSQVGEVNENIDKYELLDSLLDLEPQELGDLLNEVRSAYEDGAIGEVPSDSVLSALDQASKALISVKGGEGFGDEEDLDPDLFPLPIGFGDEEDLDEYANASVEDYIDPRDPVDPRKDMSQAERGAMHKVNEKKRDFKKLSVDEQTQLKEYINSVKEIKKEIKGLMEKAKTGGDNTGKTLSVERKKK